MSEWKEINVGETATLSYGKMPKKDLLGQGDYPTFSGYKYQFLYPKSNCKRGDLIVVARGVGGTGDVKIIKEDAFLTNLSIKIEFDPGIVDNRFFYYYFSKQTLRYLDSGSAQSQITIKDLENESFSFPSLLEQKAIASVLASFDDKIDLFQRQNRTLEAMAETLFRQWFIEEAQQDWKELALRDILEFVVDNRGKTAPTSETGIPLIATNCIKNNNIFPVYEKLRYVSEDTYKNWFRAHPMPGDIIFVNKGTPGSVNLVPDPIDFCIAQDMIALRVNANINNYYLFLYFRSPTMQSLIFNASVGTTIPHLKKTDLLNFPMTIPDMVRQKDFETIVTPFFMKMNKNYLQIRTLEKLRDTLLPKLMSGEARVEYEN